MPEPYASSVNPPRRAKRAPIIESSPSSNSPPSSNSQMRLYTPRTAGPALESAEPPPPPAKRGRKPGPLSKSAREAQRRLNHSIIEKARRTKINDALALLRQLVPIDYGQKKTPTESRDDDADYTDEDDDEDVTSGNKATQKSKGKGKKEEKEKEFKLEILVRTVSFLQDLLQQVATLEAAALTTPIQAPCQHCTAAKDRKRKHIHVEESRTDHVEARADEHPRSAKMPRHNQSDNPAPSLESILRSSRNSAETSPSLDPRPDAPNRSQSQQQLPSISSWLLPSHDAIIDPQLLPARLRSQPQNNSRTSPYLNSYLPSPPASTHVDAVRTSQAPPHLSLGPVATAAIVGPSGNAGPVQGARTPEDESAASLLLQISASSPPFRPARAAPSVGYGEAMRDSHLSGLMDPSAFLLHGSRDAERRQGAAQRCEREVGHIRHAQTPSSMLGLHSSHLTRSSRSTDDGEHISGRNQLYDDNGARR